MPVRVRLANAIIFAASVVLFLSAGCKRQDEKRRPPPSPPAATNAPAGDAFGGKKAPTVRIAELEAELAKDPKNAARWAELGNLHYDVRNREEAVNAYARALELNPKDVAVLADQAVMYRELGEREKALANLERARALDPKHVQAAFNLGVIQAELGKKQEAIESLEAVIALQPSGPAATTARQLIASLKAPTPQPDATKAAETAAPKTVR